MFNNLPLRTKLIAIVVPPLVVLAMIAGYGILIGFRGATSLDDLTGDVRALGGVATIGLLLSALGVVAISRTITDPLENIRLSAADLAENRLPLLIEALSNPAGEAPHFEPIERDTDDELGKLVDSLNAVQDAVANVAVAQRELVQKGLSELVINLARRNQSLLDRQIEAIDSLESREQDPDTLEALFGLDHLATRMRRNAESLLVLSGAEPPRRRGGPVATTDILRVAMSEIEDYRRVQLVRIEDGEIGSQAAVDLAHVCSELMENATQFSPPDQPVVVQGMAQTDGCYLISITDRGIGMNEAQLDAANAVLAEPPVLGLSLSRSLGFIVIGRLAKRLDVRVELMATDGGGTTALVLIPAVLMGNVAPAAAPPVEAPVAPVAAGPEPAWVDPGAEEESWTPPPPPARGSNPLTDPVGASAQAIESGHEPAPPFEPSPPFGEPAPHVESAASLEASPPFEPTFDPTPIAEAASAFAPAPPSAAPPSAAPESLGPSAFDAPASAEPPIFDAPAPQTGFSVPGHPEVQSEALAKLMGLIPPTTADAGSTGNDNGWAGIVFEPADSAPLPGAPARLSDAIPSGDAFDSGVDSLFAPSAIDQTDKGLAKRDRSQSHAPVSEGRPVAASVRSPEEIRQMLARYRDGRNRPTDADQQNPSNGDQS